MQTRNISTTYITRTGVHIDVYADVYRGSKGNVLTPDEHATIKSITYEINGVEFTPEEIEAWHEDGIPTIEPDEWNLINEIILDKIN
jgi:pyruvate/2-oxoacid:ferredoxin oxidoreductase alpha subunit